MVQLTCDNVWLICLQFAKMALVRIGESLREVGKILETDYVCVSTSVYVQHASAVNCRGRFSSVVNCSRFNISSALTAEKYYRILHVFLNLCICVNIKFHWCGITHKWSCFFFFTVLSKGQHHTGECDSYIGRAWWVYLLVRIDRVHMSFTKAS